MCVCSSIVCVEHTYIMAVVVMVGLAVTHLKCSHDCGGRGWRILRRRDSGLKKYWLVVKIDERDFVVFFLSSMSHISFSHLSCECECVYIC